METADQYGLYADEKENTGTERMAAFQSAVLAVNCKKPCAGLFTYNREENLEWGQYILAKILPYVVLDGKAYGPSDATQVKAMDVPGGAICTYQINNILIKIEFYPMLYGREESSEGGGAIYCISTQPLTPVYINMGGGKKSGMVGWKQQLNNEGQLVDLMTVMTRATMVSEKFREIEPQVEIQDGMAWLTAAHPYTIAVKGEGSLSKKISPDGGPYIEASLPGGSGRILLAFDRDKEIAGKLISNDIDHELQKSQAYYNQLMEACIETPDENINFAFKSAVYNLDYSYLAPYGWVEAIHHWMSIWHQQHSLAADWLGQGDRAKQVLVSQGKALYPTGAAPMFFSNGNTFRAFGGTDHFYLWQARHYLLHTNDTAFAKEILPTLETVVTHCFAENDPSGTLALHWGEQIGNQEDYLSHLHNSASPTIEGVNMLRTLSLAAKLAGHAEKSSRYDTLAMQAMDSLKALWNSELGRFNYQQDASGKTHLEGQYQTYIYPALYEMTDDLDSYTSLRHLRDRLIGEKGELYCSNNFPNHMAATLGTQAGAAQQPWGTMGLAKLGMGNEAVLPLKYIADIVADPAGCAGSWPEVAENWGSYFSPPAGVFIQSVIEALFGLTADLPQKILKISPCFPYHWDKATLTLPQYAMHYKKQGNTYQISIKNAQSLTVKISWRLPFGNINSFCVNGKAAEYKITPCVNGILLESELPIGQAHEITLEWQEIAVDVRYPKTAAEGTQINVETPFKVLGVIDRSGVCDEISMGAPLTLRLKKDLLKQYAAYGQLGLLNFARRTVFLRLEHETGLQTIYPLDFTLLPALEAAATLQSDSLALNIRNNAQINGAAALLAGGKTLALAGCESTNIKLPQDMALLPGRNEAKILTQGISADFFIKSTVPMPTKTIAIPETLLQSDSCWKDLKRMPFLPHMPWLNQKSPMEGLEGNTLFHPQLPVTFHITPQKIAPLSWKSQPRLDIPLNNGEYRKFYILLFAFLDNHDIFSPVLRITAQREDQKLASREYYTPGDMDGFWGAGAVGCFATAHNLERRQDALLPLPDRIDGDWSMAKPRSEHIYYFSNDYDDSFPASSLWSSGYTIKLPNSYACILEFDMQKANQISRLVLEPVGTNTAFGILAIEGI